MRRSRGSTRLAWAGVLAVTSLGIAAVVAGLWIGHVEGGRADAAPASPTGGGAVAAGDAADEATATAAAERVGVADDDGASGARATLRGTLVDGSGVPVEGAQLLVFPARRGPGLFRATARGEAVTARTDVAGRFALLAPTETGGVHVFARVDGLARLERYDVELEEDGGADLGALELRAGGSVELVVRDEEDRPVAAAQVYALQSDFDFGAPRVRAPRELGPPYLGETDATGRLVLADVPLGGWTLGVVARGRLGVVVSGTAAGAGEHEVRPVVLPGGVRARGHVEGDLSALPPDARVHALDFRGADGDRLPLVLGAAHVAQRSVADAAVEEDGGFELGPVDGRRRYLFVVADASGEPRTHSARTTPSRGPVVLDAAPRPRLRARVLRAEDGEPVEGLTIRLLGAATTSSDRGALEGSGPAAFPAPGRLDWDGGGLFTGGPYRLTLLAPGRAPVTVGTFRVEAGGQDLGTLQMAAAPRVVARVTDASGAPLANREVRLLHLGRGHDDRGALPTTELVGNTARTGPDGTAHLDGYPGRLCEVALLPGDGDAGSEPARLEVPAAGPVAEVLTLVARRGSSVEGVLRGVDGAPVAGRVAVRPASVVSTEGPGWLALAPPEPEDLDPREGRAARVAADGRFRFDDLLPGEHVVRGFPAGEPEQFLVKIGVPMEAGASGLRRDVHLLEGDLVTVDLFAPERHAVEGRLLLDGLGADGVRVEAYGVVEARPGMEVRMPMPAGAAVSGVDGRFRIEGLLDGPYRLDALPADGGVPTSVALRVEDRDVTGLALDLGATLSGRVVDADGEPVVDAGVVVVPETTEAERVAMDPMTVRSYTEPPGHLVTDPMRSPWRHVRSVRTDEHGRFVVAGVPVDRELTLEVRARDRHVQVWPLGPRLARPSLGTFELIGLGHLRAHLADALQDRAPTLGLRVTRLADGVEREVPRAPQAGTWPAGVRFLDPGRYRVELVDVDGGAPLDEVELSLGPGDPTAIELGG